MNPLQRLHPEFGQSIWLDFISKKLLDSGELQRLVASGEIRGVTSNPAIFEKAVGAGVEYAEVLAGLRATNPAANAFQLYEALAIRDIRAACEALKPVYDSSKARDGYVSLEVTLFDGDSTADIVREAVHLWNAVSQPNVMIKVPGTTSGIEASKGLIASGINVNVTLLFAVEQYESTAEAFISGLEARAKTGNDLSRVASVASFFVSRIDSVVDAQIDAKIKSARNGKDAAKLEALLGKAAIANAKVAYARFGKLFSGKRWDKLEKSGAQPQRVLWASTGTKSKAYSDVLYVEELIGRDTVNTAPPQTIDAFRDHGRARASLAEGLEAAKKQLKALSDADISLDRVTADLLTDGLKLFGDAFTKLLKSVEGSHSVAFAPVHFSASHALTSSIERELADWTSDKAVERLWARDAQLWSGSDEARWLAWLEAPSMARAAIAGLKVFADRVRQDGIAHVVLLGMGGSSLCPEVLKLVFGSAPGSPTLEVLDSTDPAQVAAIERKIDSARTLFIVASKSGSTLEPSIFEAYFFDRANATLGARAGSRFIAITDPGSKLEKTAKEKGYARIFAGVPQIGGRFSALSNFGLVPAALIGVDLERFVARAEEMSAACKNSVAAANPGVHLGVILGTMATLGHDKLTLIVSPKLAPLGAWLEQLIAESTGKLGKGVIPIDLEPLAGPSSYGEDRVFLYVRHAASSDSVQDAAVAAFQRAGQAVVRIDVADSIDLGAEFFRFEIATAVIGAILGINAFDQPDVEASKIAARALTEAYEQTGVLPAEKPFFEEDGITLFASRAHAVALHRATGSNANLVDVLGAHFATLAANDYVGLLAYIEMTSPHAAELTTMRTAIRDATRAATCVGFGPRFLHSTGQAYKGGPNSGVFVQITCDDAHDLQVPGAKYTFGTVKAAQARGDFEVLVERGRRALRVHLGADVRAGLTTLRKAVVATLHKSAVVRV